MAIHKISDDSLLDATFTLIAIHSYLEDYRLAYLLNGQLKSKFRKASYDIESSGDIAFGLFEWEDTYQDSVWSLITNTSSVQVREKITTNLFENNESTFISYLVPEHKNVDYFLKIDNGGVYGRADSVIQKINEITEIATSYSINPDQLKSKKNLIF